MQYAKSILAFLLCFSIWPTCALPSSFSGQWVKDDKSESGEITIRISESSGDHAQGTIEISGSSYCKAPVPFRGIVEGQKLKVESDAKVVCGFRGKLFGEVEEDKDGYKGSFYYRFLGAVWIRGTFQLKLDK